MSVRPGDRQHDISDREYVSICVHVFMHAWCMRRCMYVNVCVYACMHACVRACMHACMHACQYCPDVLAPWPIGRKFGCAVRATVAAAAAGTVVLTSLVGRVRVSSSC